MKFRDRSHAGKDLTQYLVPYRLSEPLIFALPCGGVPVGREIAYVLKAPLEVLLVRRIGCPYERELAAGAVSEDGNFWIDDKRYAAEGIDRPYFDRILAHEFRKLKRQKLLFRGSRPRPRAAGRDVILVDAGLATGSSMTAAVMLLSKEGAQKIIVAVPVASAEGAERVRAEGAEVIAIEETDRLGSISQFYE